MGIFSKFVRRIWKRKATNKNKKKPSVELPEAAPEAAPDASLPKTVSICATDSLSPPTTEHNKHVSPDNNSNDKKLETVDKPKSLKQEISEFLSMVSQNCDKETLKVLHQTTRDLIDQGVAEKALRPPQLIPPFALPDDTGTLIQSSELLTQADHTLVIFFRGNWCPFCKMELNAYQKCLSLFQEQGVEIVAISPNRVEVTAKMVQDRNVGFKVLSDVQNQLSSQFGLVFEMDDDLRPIYKSFGYDIPKENGDDSYQLPLTSKYVVDREGKILYSHVEADYTKQPEPQDILQKILETRSVEETMVAI